MLGKTFKGLTERCSPGRPSELLELEIGRDGYTVHVRPELVVEIAFNDIQESPQYPGRLALRFARVKRYRPDKSAADRRTRSNDPINLRANDWPRSAGRHDMGPPQGGH